MSPITIIVFSLVSFGYVQSHSISPAGYQQAGRVIKDGAESAEGIILAVRQELDESHGHVHLANTTALTEPDSITDASLQRSRRCCCCPCCCCCCSSGSGSGESGATIGDMIGLASLISRKTVKRMAKDPSASKIVKRRSAKDMKKRNAVGSWARSGGVIRHDDDAQWPVATLWSEGGRLMKNGSVTTDHRKVTVQKMDQMLDLNESTIDNKGPVMV